MNKAARDGRVAQLGEHLLCKQGVAGSIPATSTNFLSNLLGERVHAARAFSTADGAQDGNSGRQAALGNSEPIGSFGRHRFARAMNLADDEEQVISLGRARWCW